MGENSTIVRLLHAMILGLVVASVFACAPTATLTHFSPAAVETGVRRLALLDIQGGDEFRQQAQQEFVAGLRKSGIYELVFEADLAAVAPVPLRLQDGSLNMPATIEAARRVGAEGLLVPRLWFVEDNGARYGTVRVQIGDPQVAAQLQYSLWDVRSGQLLAKGTLTSSYYRGELQRRGTGPNSEPRVLSGLAAECATQLVHALTPHSEATEVALANQLWGTGASEMRSGNRAAADGNWSEALRQWGSVVLADGNNAAAWYNVGLAYEALSEFEQAHGAYEQAQRLDEQPEYQAAIARVQSAAEQFQIAVAQSTRARAILARTPAP